ncbi:mitotic fidelity of chromosome transmission- protein [Emydomyces testavorans]|uniref:CENP-C homolog n=1 Tax=Emydomyces testavorans TaxID=2070801 RepID=A0AAF0DRU8_9EURO|nr:mitotic fidelity of chromosome transmission- protein [Emydomyces testavorans]
MAARRAPPKAREMDFGNVGVAGRRTGVTLEKGKLDEHGMEEIDGMFSSPEKSPLKRNINGFGNDTIIHSEDMETGGITRIKRLRDLLLGSSIPEPADMLSARRGSRTAYVLPPRSRSPIKTNLSGSPRRTPGIRSSPIPQSDQISSPSSRTVATRTLNFSKAQIQLGKSPLKQVRATSIPLELESPAGRESGEEVGNDVGGQTADFSDDGNYLVEGAAEESIFLQPLDDNGGRNARGKHVQNEDINKDEAGEDAEEGQSPPVKAASKGRKRKDASANPESTVRQTDGISAAKGRRGKKPKGPRVEAKGVNEEDENPRPAKRTKTATGKGPTAGLQMSTEQEKELNQVIENITKRDGPLKQRSLHILRKEAPSDETVQHTRSGRVSVKPLAYWRNEKCVYGTGEAEIGQRFPLSTIKEIIRIEEPESTFTKGSKRSSKKKSKAKKNRYELSEDETDNAEPWETDVGVFYGPVKSWDSELQAGTQEEEMMDIAYAPSAIQTLEVKGSTFRFAKILSTPFLGSGFVEMPPGAVKRQKNSKRMHMVFFVYRGRIRVDVSGLEFSAGKGCVFQVPRGNNYSFANEYDKSAAIFFTQGCIPLDSDENGDTGAPVPPLTDQTQQSPEENAEENPEEQPQEEEQQSQPAEKEKKEKSGKKKRGRPKQNA